MTATLGKKPANDYEAHKLHFSESGQFIVEDKVIKFLVKFQAWQAFPLKYLAEMNEFLDKNDQILSKNGIIPGEMIKQIFFIKWPNFK